MAEHTKTPWRILQDFEPQTGPTTNVTEPFCGGKDWPFETIMVGIKTIAIVPAQATYQRVGKHSPPIEGSSTANARFIVTACNNHDKLVKALQGCETLLTMIESDHLYSVPLILNQVRQALKEVETKRTLINTASEPS